MYLKDLRCVGSLAAFIFLIGAPSAIASEEWLVGYWEGTVIGAGDSDQTRGFRVPAVDADGTFDALWAIGKNVATNVSGRLDNDTLTLTLVNGIAPGTTIILAKQGAETLIGVGNQVGVSAHQVVLHKKSSRWNETSIPSGCDYQGYYDSGLPSSIRHLTEGQTTSEVGSHNTLICKDGVFQRVRP